MKRLADFIEWIMTLHKRSVVWRRFISVLAAVVVFTTTYALILPALTLDKKSVAKRAGIEIEETTDAEPAPEAPKEEKQEEPKEEVKEEPAAEPAEVSSPTEEKEEPQDPQPETPAELQEPQEEQKSDDQPAAAGSDQPAQQTEEQVEAEAPAEEVTEPVQAAEVVDGITTFKFEDKDYTLTATYGKDAGLPDDVSMLVEEIHKDKKAEKELYLDYYEKALEAVEKDRKKDSDFEYARFFDISFLSNGKEVEPKGPVTVKVEFEDAIDVKDEKALQILHFEEDEKYKGVDLDKAEIKILDEKYLTTDLEDKKVTEIEFDTDRFSVYGVVYTVNYEFANGILKARYDVDGDSYQVSVEYPTSARIRAGSSLRVELIPEDSDLYREYLAQAAASLEEPGKTVTTARFFDITIIDPDGKEVEPAAAVIVNIALAPMEGNGSVDLIHFSDDGTKTIVEDKDLQRTDDNEVEGVQFEADGFSVYGVIGSAVIEASEGDYVFKGDGYTVKITVTKEAAIPVGTVLTVSELSPSSDEYVQRLGQAWAEINREYLKNVEMLADVTEDLDSYKDIRPVNIDDARFLDISFKYQDNNIEPLVPVHVEITYADGLDSSAKSIAKVVHFHDGICQQVDGVDTKEKGGKVVGFSYDQTHFSDFGTLVGQETEDDAFKSSGLFVAKAAADEIVRGDSDSGSLADPIATKTKKANNDPDQDGYGDGTYNISLSIAGTAKTSELTKVNKSNVVVVMDRSSSMTNPDNNIYYVYNKELQEGVTYYGRIDNQYETLIYNNGSLYRNTTVRERWTGTRYMIETGNQWSGNDYNYGRDNNGHYFPLHQSGYQWYDENNNLYTGTTRYRITEGTANNYNYALIDGEYVQLIRDGNNWYHEYTTTVPYTGSVYLRGTRLDSEQLALDQLLGELTAKNRPGETITDEDGKVVSLDDIIEVKIISFASGRTDRDKANNFRRNNNTVTTYIGFTQENDKSKVFVNTESNWETTKSALMPAVDEESVAKGTNWEEAMQYAREVADAKKAAQPDEPVFVIFLTDGEPTDRVGDNGNAQYSGNDNQRRDCMIAARDDAYGIVNPHTITVTNPNWEESTVQSDFTLFNIFTYGANDTYKGFLRNLTNYAYLSGGNVNYNNDNDNVAGGTADYFFDATNYDALMDAFQNIMDSIMDSLAYGNVSIFDGVTSDAATSTIISGDASGFTYSVEGPLATIYTVSAEEVNGETQVTFTQASTGQSKTVTELTEEPVTYIDATGATVTKTRKYYAATFGEGSSAVTYKMTLATVDNTGLVHWDLSDIGTLQNDYTYTVSFNMWPNQDAYDYVAGLNNELGDPYIWDTSASTYEDLTDEKGYEVGGVEQYPNIVRYPDNHFEVLTNFRQDVQYALVEETTVDGVTTIKYGETQTMTLDPPTPMILTGEKVDIVKEWADELDPSHLLELIKKAEAEGKTYGVTLNVYEDEKFYKAYTFEPVLNAETGHYEWPAQTVSIAPAILVSHHPGGSTEYKTVYYDANNDGTKEMYYVLNEGHQYTIEETETDFHFEFHADPYHPALVDGVMTNMSFVVDAQDAIVSGSEAERVGDIPLESFIATNSLTSELDITKKINDTTDALTDDQEKEETFTYKVTLTVPYDPEDPDKYTQYMNAYEWVPRTDVQEPNQTTRFYVYGYQDNENEAVRGLDDDVSRFNHKIFGRYTVSYPDTDHEDHTLVDIFTPDAGGKTQTGTLFITLKRDEIVRITNLPKGSTYKIQEIYANLRQADPSRDADTTPEANTESSNIEQQGYSISVRTKNGSPAISQTATANDTVSGTIAAADTRYYNQFTNTLSDAASIQLAVEKHLEGYTWSGERYYMKLTAGEGNDTLDRFTVAQTQRYLSRASGSEDVSYTFTQPVRFSAPGTYIYYFTEMEKIERIDGTDVYVNPISGTTVNGIQYGDVSTVKVTVENVNGKLTVTSIDGSSDGVRANSDYSVITARITNKVIPVSLYKIRDGVYDRAFGDIQFKLYSDEDCKQQVTEDARGNTIGTEGVITTSSEEGSVGTAVIGVLNPGTYYLKETVTPDGYNEPAGPVSITVAEDGTVTYSQSDFIQSAKGPDLVYKGADGNYYYYSPIRGDESDIYADDEDYTFAGYRIVVNNSPGVELPHAGGPGTLLYTLSGLAMIATALMYGFRMRRRERRVNG